MKCTNCDEEIYFKGDNLTWYHIGSGYGHRTCDIGIGTVAVAKPKIDEPKTYCKHCLEQIFWSKSCKCYLHDNIGNYLHCHEFRSMAKAEKKDDLITLDEIKPEGKCNYCDNLKQKIDCDSRMNDWFCHLSCNWSRFIGKFNMGDSIVQPTWCSLKAKEPEKIYCNNCCGPKPKEPEKPKDDLIILDEVMPYYCDYCKDARQINNTDKKYLICSLKSGKLIGEYIQGGLYYPPTWCPLKAKEPEKTDLRNSLEFFIDKHDRGYLSAEVLIDVIITRFEKG